jgi:hypothetical protein
VELIHLAQDRDWWHAVVNTVMNLQVLAPRSSLVSKFSHTQLHSLNEHFHDSTTNALRKKKKFAEVLCSLHLNANMVCY